MINELKNFFMEEDGLGTVEIVLILAVLVGIALIFRRSITDFMTTIMESINEGLDEGSTVVE